MSKTYIFGPTTVELTVSEGLFSAEPTGSELFNSNIDLEGAIAQIGNTKFVFCPPFDEYNGEAVFTPNGEDDPNHGVTFSNVYSGPILISGASEDITESGTYEVSVYIGEDDPKPSNGLPDMNITYEFKNTAQNDIEEIIQAIYTRLEEVEEPTNGHSPADRLVVAVAVYFGIDPEVALTMGNYPNQMKRIAAIIRGDFSVEEQAIFG